MHYLKIVGLSASVALLAACGSAKETPREEMKVESLEQRLSYSLGYDIGQTLLSQGFKLDVTLMAQGVEDAMNDSAGIKPLMTREQMQQTFQEWQQASMQKAQEQARANAAQFEAEGQAYMAEEAKKPGISRTNSGLLYEVIAPGAGPKPGPTSTVKVHYEGTLIDGTKFDSSYDRGEPSEFPLNGVIPGWTEGLQLMSPGAKYRLIIPSELAYGTNPPPGSPIKPGSTLIFMVELLEIVKQ